MPTLDFATVESASVYMHASLEQKGFVVDATCSPSSDDSSEESYRRYIALTQRICSSTGTVLFYLTYRVTKATSIRNRPTFSSYEILSSNYDKIVGAKWHLSLYSDFSEPAKACFKDVFNYIMSHYYERLGD